MTGPDVVAVGKVAAVDGILSNASLTAEQKLDAILEVLYPSQPRQSPLRSDWNPADDPDIHGRAWRPPYPF